MKRTAKKVRGVYEHPPGSGTWWVQHFDADGRRRREKVGPKSAAIDLAERRRSDKRKHVKLPDNLRVRSVMFHEIAKAALEYSKEHKRSYYSDTVRMARLLSAFGQQPAESIKREDVESWLNETADEREWTLSTKNRHLALLKLTFRLAEENKKVKVNPTRLLRLRKEDNQRIRYLNQFKPTASKLAYLNDCHDEENRIRAVIATEYPHHLPEFEIALHTGMRASEQYRLEWSDVNFERKFLTVTKSKNGKTRHIPLNRTALAVLEFLHTRASDASGYVFLGEKGERLVSNRHWFPKAVEKAGLRDFTWHCLRHTFASRLAMAGVDVLKIKELLGHESLEMTCRYSHLAPSALAAAVETLVTEPSATTSATSPESAALSDSRKMQ